MVLLAFKAKSKCGVIGDRIISFFTRSKYSHVAIIVDGKIYEAHMEKGVRVGVAVNLNNDCLDRYEVKLRGKENSRDLITILSRMIKEGKRKNKYNLLGAILSLFRINLRREDKLFCSEYLAVGFGLSRPASYTPRRLISELRKIGRI